MSDMNDPIFSAVLSLPPEERARLADRLLEKFHSAHDAEIDAAEVEERIEAMRCGDPERLHELESAVRA